MDVHIVLIKQVFRLV